MINNLNLFVLLICFAVSGSLEIKACTLPRMEHGSFHLQYGGTPVKDKLHDGAKALIKCDQGYAPLEHHKEFTCNATDPNPEYPMCVLAPAGYAEIEVTDFQDETHDHHDDNGAHTASSTALFTATISTLLSLFLRAYFY
ncbi:hypothetical protein ACHWQZ_G013317 [Mnemiopsis leidyi]